MESTTEAIARLELAKKTAGSKEARKIRKQLRILKRREGLMAPAQPRSSGKATPRGRYPKAVNETTEDPIPEGPVVIPEGVKKIPLDGSVVHYCFVGPYERVPQMIKKFEARWGYPPTYYSEHPKIRGYAFGPVPTNPWYETKGA